jgi:type 2A phosphatase activator TIP41
MADHSWLEATTAHLEQLAQPAGLRRRRRLTLPEVCFAHAAVAIQLPTGTLLSWTVQEALEEWSRAHQHIGMGSYEHRSRGVQVLKSADADLWKSKITTATACDFHYDWTFCTPFCGHVSAGQWIPMAASGIQVELLKDTTQPILYFDEIELYQDDLHDNGVVNFRIKLRVMPTCIYVLARCWLRVDGVVLTSRETRIFVDFGSQDNSLRVYRDITWRQAWWKDLARKGLPTDVRAWKNEGPTETAAWQALVNRLPLDELPNDLVAHSILQLKNDKMETTKRI